MTPRAITVFFVTAALHCLSGCANRNAPADELFIASPHRDEIKEEIERAFRSWYLRELGREVHPIWLDLGGSSNIQKYLADRLSKGSTAGVDVFYGGGSDPFDALKRQGHLIAYRLPEPILSRIPTDLDGVPLYDPEHFWYGVVLSSFGIMYNNEVLRRLDFPTPSTWEDLGSLAYAQSGGRWVGMADPRHSSSVHVIYENILQAYGWERGFAVLARAAANTKDFVRESSTVPRQVQLGEVACAPVIDLYAFSLITREGPDRIGFALPEGETVVTPDPVGIVRGAPNQPAAEAFVRFSLCEEGQKVWMLRPGLPGGPNRYDLARPGVLAHLYDEIPADELAVTINPFKSKAALKYDGRVASKRWNVLNDLLGAVLIDSQSELQQAWAVVQKTPNNSDLIEQLTRPPCDPEQMTKLAEPLRQSARLRNETIATWMSDARSRYRAVAESARRRNTP